MEDRENADLSARAVLVTGANSGLGFEAAAQLAEAGYGRVILACRTLDKAATARRELVERVGQDPFEPLAVELSTVASADAAVEELARRGGAIDALLLNAGMASGEQMQRSAEGLELQFASSIIGHHVLTLGLSAAGLLVPGARVVIAGSEAANNDLPGMMDMAVYDFVVTEPGAFGPTLDAAMDNFARGARPDRFRNTRYYATTKVFTAWWAASAGRRFSDRIRVFAVSPGAAMRSNAGRNLTGLKKLLFTRFMPLIGPLIGMDQPLPVAARRYLDVMHDVGMTAENGAVYTSAPGKLVGPLRRMTHPHLLDEERQECAWRLLERLTAEARGGAEAR